MKLSRLILKNVKCYKTLDLTFEDVDESSNEEVRMRTIILGNNGTGKSTILKSIALLLCGSSALGELIGNPERWIRRGQKSCAMSATLLTTKGESREVSIRINTGDNLHEIISRNRESLKVIDGALEHTERSYLNLGYGVHRRVASSQFFKSKDNFSSNRASNVSTLFESDAVLYPLESWMMDLDYRKGEQGLESVKDAINALLPGHYFHSIDKEKRTINFKNKDGIISFDLLSDGFQITANWLGDLLYRITNTYGDYNNPQDARFILLIDEIALHLHPEWQRTIIQSITNLFPNAQIIATTHSPFVAQQAGDSELFTIIRKDDGDLDLFHYENDPRKLLIHQLIMSDVFGLITDESIAVEEIKAERRKNLRNAVTQESVDRPLSMTATPAHGKKLKGIDSITEVPTNKESYLGKIEGEDSREDMYEILKELRKLKK